MSREFLLPDLGEGLTEAEIVRWLVAEGDTVVIDQPVVEVETAKALVEVPVPYAGTVTTLHAPVGRTVDVGRPLITIGTGATTLRQEPGGFTEPGVETSGNVLVGYGTSTRGRRGRTKAVAAPRATAEVVRNPAVISPVVRKLARDAGVDLRTITGSGEGGLILRHDVQAVLDKSAAPAIEREPSVSGGERRIPLTGIRGMAAERLARSRREIPEATVWVDVDATEFLDIRKKINEVTPDRPVSILGLLSRFCVLGLRRYPELNSTVDTGRGEIVVHEAVNLGFAAQTPRGLMVPVIHDATHQSARALTESLGALTTKARENHLSPADLSGGTFTINNYGVFGVDGSAAIINHPEAAILGIGRIMDRPWAHDGGIALRKITELTLSFDHRVCDGGTAAGFLRFVAGALEHPTALLADL